MRTLFVGLLMTLAFSNLLAQTQQAQSYMQLPEDNKMVSQALTIYNKLLKNDTTDCMHYFNNQESNISDFIDFLPKFITGTPIDTLMIEYYSGQGHTTINFVTKDEETKVEYLLKTVSTGTKGSIDNFSFWIFKDEKADKLRQLINELDPK
jgi:hypothetical protein